jgi:hypothetical protein
MNTANGNSGVYQDAACRTNAAEGLRACAAPKEISFVAFGAAQNDRIAAIHKGGAALAQAFRKDGDLCVPVGALKNIFSVGIQLPLTTFASAEVTKKLGSSQLNQTIWRAGSATFPQFDNVTSPLNRSVPCELATTDDDVIRCAPSGSDSGLSAFADPACRDPVWQTDAPIFSIRAPDPLPIKGAPVDISLPRILRVLSGGMPHTGPIYSKLPTSRCERTGVPTAKLPYRRGMIDLPPKDLIAMPFVIR